MGFARGFLEYDRIESAHEEVKTRIKHHHEFIKTLSASEIKIQAGRCMDCGIPFCSQMCPLHNLMPEINDKTCQEDFDAAYKLLALHSPMPEITGRICPALCEEACTLGLHYNPVGIKSVERMLGDYAIEQGLIKAQTPLLKTHKKVAIVGSGPAALACAQSLSIFGHEVCVFEKNAHLGGLLRLGIPDFKLDKTLIDRRIAALSAQGVRFVTQTLVGAQELEHGIFNEAQHFISAKELKAQYDAIVLCVGSETPRDLNIEGRNLPGIYFALDFLIAQNLENQGLKLNPIVVKDKKVVVIGGGETASDCIGTAIRKGASSVTQVDYHEELPQSVDPLISWPYYRKIKRTSTSQEEGCTRLFATNTTAFLGDHKVSGIKTVKVKWGPMRKITTLEGTEGRLDADVVLIALGYAHPSLKVSEAFKLKTTPKGTIEAQDQGKNAYQTSDPKIFAAGDGRFGQSLVVYALKEGLECAQAVNTYLKEN